MKCHHSLSIRCYFFCLLPRFLTDLTAHSKTVGSTGRLVCIRHYISVFYTSMDIKYWYSYWYIFCTSAQLWNGTRKPAPVHFAPYRYLSRRTCCLGEVWRSSESIVNLGGGVAQLVEHQTGMPLIKVRFPSMARHFSPRVSFQCRLWLCPYSPMCSRMH